MISKLPHKVLFYTSIPRLFRTTLIGHLYEIAQVHPVILLSEKLDYESEKAVKNKELFPKLEAIVPVHQWTGTRRYSNISAIENHRFFHQLAKRLIKQYKPDIVITANNTYPFELYLLRYAKSVGAVCVNIQAGFNMDTGKNESLWTNLMEGYSRFNVSVNNTPLLYYIRCKKLLLHLYHYWFVPLCIGSWPMIGRHSFILRKRLFNLNDNTYKVVQSKRDYEIMVNDGYRPSQLLILSHPLKRITKKIFDDAYFSKMSLPLNTNSSNVLTIMLPVEKTGIRRSDKKIIPERIINESRIKIINFCHNILHNWVIIIKPHPALISKKNCEKALGPLPNNVIVVEPQEPADKFIEVSKVIIGVPPASTTLYTASLQSPEKIILSLNFEHQLLGDSYRDFDGIEFIDNYERFIKVLESIRDNKYHGTYNKDSSTERQEDEYSNILEIFEYLLHKERN